MFAIIYAKVCQEWNTKQKRELTLTPVAQMMQAYYWNNSFDVCIVSSNGILVVRGFSGVSITNIYIRHLSSVQNKCGPFCMTRTTFRDLCVGGVLVKTCINALCRSTFLKDKQINHNVEFNVLFGFTDS